MKPNQEVLIKKFKIKKTRKYGSKPVKKSESQLKKEMYTKMKKKNSMGKAPSKQSCNAYLAEQIRNNIRSGKWHYKQAIAIAYKQTKAKQSGCKKYYDLNN